MQNKSEVMRVVRIPPRGQLVVQVGQERYQDIAGISNAATRQRVLVAIGELVSFVGGYSVLVDAGFAPPIAASNDTVMAAPTTSLAEQQEAFLQSLSGQGSGGTSNISLAPPPPPKTTNDANTLNIASQINVIIKRHLASNQKLSDRRVELHSKGSNGLLIEVDGKFHDSPNEIEDKEVRFLIKMALREWDKG
ncbi:MAG: hypothetical protein KAG66_15655 [Methylococcales bacterium]|nr:hypothetical protein [Methylococcales bacterium]